MIYVVSNETSKLISNKKKECLVPSSQDDRQLEKISLKINFYNWFFLQFSYQLSSPIVSKFKVTLIMQTLIQIQSNFFIQKFDKKEKMLG